MTIPFVAHIQFYLKKHYICVRGASKKRYKNQEKQKMKNANGKGHIKKEGGKNQMKACIYDLTGERERERERETERQSDRQRGERERARENEGG